jgi:hypothetical protein
MQKSGEVPERSESFANGNVFFGIQAFVDRDFDHRNIKGLREHELERNKYTVIKASIILICFSRDIALQSKSIPVHPAPDPICQKRALNEYRHVICYSPF